MSARDTAVLLPVPQVDPVVDRWRQQYEPGWAKGIPAHVTLCFPFAPPERVDEGVMERLDAIFRRTAPFPFRFARTNRFPATLWLAPEPSDPFRDLTETLCAAFPSVRPYGGRFGRVIPHLTVADRVTEQTMDRLDAAISPLLPVEAEATEAWLMEGDDDRWVLRQTFPLRGQGASSPRPATSA